MTKVKYTEQPSYEIMQGIWQKYPEAKPMDFSQCFEWRVKQVLDSTVILSSPGETMEVEVSIDQIHFPCG